MSTDVSLSRGAVTTSYRLQDITDVHMIARLQEASGYKTRFNDHT